MSIAQHENANGPEKLTRIISIRISEQEFQDLQRLSRASGARSIADIARHSLQQTLARSTADSTHSVAIYMYLLHQTVQGLASEVKQCTQMLADVSKTKTGIAKARVKPAPAARHSPAPHENGTSVPYAYQPLKMAKMGATMP